VSLLGWVFVLAAVIPGVYGAFYWAKLLSAPARGLGVTHSLIWFTIGLTALTGVLVVIGVRL
jgi:hypothetical protein